jgi:hypothetical protein
MPLSTTILIQAESVPLYKIFLLYCSMEIKTYSDLKAIWELILNSNMSNKEFNQMAMGCHSENITECDGWRSVEATFKDKHMRIVVEKNPSGYHMYNTTNECSLRFILTKEEGESLIKDFHIITARKIPVIQ